MSCECEYELSIPSPGIHIRITTSQLRCAWKRLIGAKLCGGLAAFSKHPGLGLSLTVSTKCLETPLCLSKCLEWCGSASKRSEAVGAPAGFFFSY